MTASEDHLDPALRAEALSSLLIERGLIDEATVNNFIKTYEQSVGPLNGAKVVARAWADPGYTQRLLADGNAAAAEAGFGEPDGFSYRLKVVANQPGLHNLIVCTLCSCYPVSLLGPSPSWYKSLAYRARAVREPGAVLAEFGLDLPADTQVAVWDANSETRYMVLPSRPPGTGHLAEPALAALVTRNGLIGTATV